MRTTWRRPSCFWRSCTPDSRFRNGLCEIDGRIKAEFNTREGAKNGAIELKRRFPALRIRLYDAETQSRHDVQA